MSFNLIKFSSPKEYSKVINQNLNNLKELEENKYLKEYLKVLKKETTIDEKYSILYIKRHLLTNLEYNLESNLKFSKIPFFLYYFLRILLSIFQSLIKYDKKNNYNLLIDDWYNNSIKSFYSFSDDDFKDIKFKIMNASQINKILFRDLYKSIFIYFKTRKIIKILSKELNINFKFIHSIIILNFFTGRYLKYKFNPKIILSGNDNGFPYLKAKSANCKLFTIQNGIRGKESDANFTYADLYFSFLTKESSYIREEGGCINEKHIEIGSYRLSEFYKNYIKTPIKFDVTYIGTYSNSIENECLLKHFFSHKTNEVESIKTFNSLTKEFPNLKFSYFPRNNNEIFELEKSGLISDNIEYLDRNTYNIYNVITSTNLILSSCSTTGIEALALNKKIGFINQSGNEDLNPLFFNEEIEFKKNIYFPDDLKSFIEHILTHSIRIEKYIKQDFDAKNTILNYIKEYINEKES
ncbi:hypothetical protein [Silvanigrella sp.]|jgi:hypothetical protein|uniref:hypothetical protein n=1 Tax=Silvanigrella sp. TaxID=2024976 RepID=UPI0037C91B9D